MYARTYATVFSQLATIDFGAFPGGCFGAVYIYITGVPDEVLKEFIGILLLHDETGGFDDIAGILDKSLSIGRQLVDVNGFSISEIRQRLVDLGVIRHATLPESLDDSI